MSLPLNKWLNEPRSTVKCSQLGCTEEASDDHAIDGKPVCEDCYFEFLGELVEQHPIGHPNKRTAT